MPGDVSSTTLSSSAASEPLPALQSLTNRCLDSESGTCLPPPLMYCRSAAVGGPAPAAMPSLHQTANATAGVPDAYRAPAVSRYRANGHPDVHPRNVNTVPNFIRVPSTSSYAFSSAGLPRLGYHQEAPAASIAYRTAVDHSTSNSMSGTYRPRLNHGHSVAFGGSAPMTVPIRRTVNPTAAVPDIYRAPATSLYQANGHPAFPPSHPRNANTVTNFVRAPPISSYGADAFSSAGLPPSGYHHTLPAVTVAGRTDVNRNLSTSNSVSGTRPPPLTHSRTAVVGGPAPTAMPNAAAGVPDAYRVPATSFFQVNGHPAVRPTPPGNVNTVSNFVRAPPISSYGSDDFSSAVHPPQGYREVEPTAAVAHQTTVPTSEGPAVTMASTIPTASGDSCRTSLETSVDVCRLLRRLGDLVYSVMRTSFISMRDVSTVIMRARTDPYCMTFPCIEEAWSRLDAIGGQQLRVRSAFDAYREFVRRIFRGEVDVGKVTVVALDRRVGFVLQCWQLMKVMNEQLRSWKLLDDEHRQPSGGALGACATGLADEILQLSDKYLDTLTAFEKTILVNLPSSNSPLEPPVGPVTESHTTDVPPEFQQPADNVDDAASRITPETFEQFRLSPGSEQQQRIAARFMEDVDRLLTSHEPLVSDDISFETSHNRDPQAEPAANVVQPFVIVPDGTGDDGTPLFETEVKHENFLTTDSRQRRTRRIDLGTIDLDPVDDDNGSSMLPPDVNASEHTWTGVDEVSIAPALNVASDKNFVFVQYSVPTEFAESSGGDEASAACLESRMITPSSETTTADVPTATDFSFESLLNYDVKGQNRSSATLPLVLYNTEHSNLPGSESAQTSTADSHVVDLISCPDESPVETKTDIGFLDVRWPSLNFVVPVPGNDPYEGIRFSLSSAFQQSDFAAAQKQETQKVEELSSSCFQSLVVDEDASGDDVVVVCEQQVAAPSSEPVVILVDDHDEGSCCQILNVFSLPPEDDNAASGDVRDSTEPEPVTDHASGPGNAATTDASCQTASVEVELNSDSATADCSTTNNDTLSAADFASSAEISDDTQQVSDAVTQEMHQSTTTGTQPPNNNNDVVEDSLPSVYCPEVTDGHYGASPLKKKRGSQTVKRDAVAWESCQLTTMRTDRPNTGDVVGESVPSLCSANNNDTLNAADFASSAEISDDTQQVRDAVTQEMHQPTTTETQLPNNNNDVVEESLPTVCCQKVTDGQYSASPLKKKRGRPPGSHTVKRDAVAWESCQLTTMRTDRPNTGDVLGESVSSLCLKKVTGRENDAASVKKRRRRPHCKTVKSLLSLDTGNSSQTKPVENEFISNSSTADLNTNTNNNDVISRDFASSTKLSDVVPREKFIGLKKGCRPTTKRTRSPDDDAAAEDLPLTLRRQKVTDNGSDAPPVKRKPGRPPGPSLHTNAETLSSNVHANKYTHKKESTKISENRPYSSKVKRDKDSSRKFCSTSQTVNPFARILSKDELQSKKQPHASMMFWQPCSTVNLAPVSVDGRCSAGNVRTNGGKVGLASEWKPAVAKRSQERKMEQMPISTSTMSDSCGNCQPLPTNHDLSDDKPGPNMPQKHLHSPVPCVETEEQYSDVEPMSPRPQAPPVHPSSEQRTGKTDERVFEDISDDEEPERDKELELMQLEAPSRLVIDLGGVDQDRSEKSADDALEDAAHPSPDAQKAVEADVRSRVDGASSHINTDTDSSGSKCERKSKQHLYDARNFTTSKRKSSVSTKHHHLQHSKHHRSESRSSTPGHGSGSAHYLMELWTTASAKEASAVVERWGRKVNETKKGKMEMLCRHDVALDLPEHRTSELEENERRKQVGLHLLVIKVIKWNN